MKTILAMLCLLPFAYFAAPASAADAAFARRAEEALRVAPVSVTQKTRPAPGGDPHDYASTAPYFWPDPEKPDGLPYVRRDGEINPESRTAASDLQRAQTLSRTVEILARAYAATEDEKYAAHAARMLRTWFLDPATFMKPHLEYAQGVPGVSTGRQFGIIEGTSLVNTLEYSRMLEGSRSWTAVDRDALLDWTSRFLDWYLTSRFGVAEAATRNNHGTHYDVQVMRMAFMVGRVDLATRVAEEAKLRRISAQIEPDGKQPHELARTGSLSYSLMNLRGLMDLADLASRVGVDLWHYESPKGAGIRRALDYVLPYLADPAKPWPYEQIKAVDRSGFGSYLRKASRVYDTDEYAAVADRLSRER